MKNIIAERLTNLYKSWTGEKPDSISPLPKSASYRRYFRIKSNNKNAIGVYNADRKENEAFISFTKHFLKHNFHVPQLYTEELDNHVYLLEDLGDTTLYSLISGKRNDDQFTSIVLEHYKRSLKELIKFQVKASQDLDYSVCYPRNSFDQQSIMWDLNYFKYYFVKLTQTPFDEQKLEDDFNSFIKLLLSTETNYFMYRDFQSRNIMIKDNELYFIDYQGGRKGALQYDVASLLYDAKADLPQDLRNELLEFYISLLTDSTKIRKDKFKKYFYSYVLIRIFQSMGTYGFRGVHEKKAHFLKSIPYAINNLEYLFQENLFPERLNELKSVLQSIINNNSLRKTNEGENSDKLTVSVNSFSYNSGIPTDLTGNGGGFVFDCRSLHNPGRYDEFKMLTGKDKPVIDFLNKENSVKEFLSNVYSIIEPAIKNYEERGFKHLMINFGCTGGQHRSVFCAEKVSEYLRKLDNVNVITRHTELEKRESS